MSTVVAPRSASSAKTLRHRFVATARRWPIHLTLFVVAAVWIVPALGVFVTSVRPRNDILGSGWWTILLHPNLTLGAYSEVLGSFGFGQAFLNSVFITVPATVLPISIGALAAYAFAFMRFPGRKTIFFIIIALMVMPTQAAFVPILQMFRALNLNGGFIGIWLAHTAFGLPFAIFLLRGFFVQLPGEILESAQIDGASSLRIFWSIILPHSKPALASLAVFQFLWVWNDLIMNLILLSNPALYPLPVQTAGLLSGYGQEHDLVAASSVLLMIVPLIVFLSLQRYFVRGIVAGSVK